MNDIPRHEQPDSVDAAIERRHEEPQMNELVSRAAAPSLWAWLDNLTPEEIAAL